MFSLVDKCADALIGLHVQQPGNGIVEAYHTDIARDVQWVYSHQEEIAKPFGYIIRKYGTYLFDLSEQAWMQQHCRREHLRYCFYIWNPTAGVFDLQENVTKESYLAEVERELELWNQ